VPRQKNSSCMGELVYRLIYISCMIRALSGKFKPMANHGKRSTKEMIPWEYVRRAFGIYGWADMITINI
jgi:hypothetical protein